MHIALCVWGLLRSLPYTINSFTENIVNPIVQHDHSYEVFVHTYNFSGLYYNPRGREEVKHLNFDDWAMLNPSYVYMEDQDELDKKLNYSDYAKLGDPWKNNLVSLKNHIRALNSLNHLAHVVEERAKIKDIDAVVFLRPDVQYLNPLPVHLLSCHIKNRARAGHRTTGVVFDTKDYHSNYSNDGTNTTNSNYSLHSKHTIRRLLSSSVSRIDNSDDKTLKRLRLFMPDFHRSCKGEELNDRMAMGDLQSALIYGKKFQAALSYAATRIIHSEKFTYQYLKANNVEVVEIPFRFRRIRANGLVHVRDHEIITPEEQYKLSKSDKPPLPGPWFYRLFHSTNYGDPSNQFCTPQKRFTYAQVFLSNEECIKRYKLPRPHGKLLIDRLFFSLD